jgi:hypothetical protein
MQGLLGVVVKRGVVGKTEGTCVASIFSISFDLVMERRLQHIGGNVDVWRGIIG